MAFNAANLSCLEFGNVNGKVKKLWFYDGGDDLIDEIDNVGYFADGAEGNSQIFGENDPIFIVSNTGAAFHALRMVDVDDPAAITVGNWDVTVA